METLPRRKLNRLRDYDYSRNGAYHIVICVQNDQPLLGTIPVGANCVRPPAPSPIHLSDIGQIVEQEIHIMATSYDRLTVEKYVIMPDHIHLLLLIQTVDITHVGANCVRPPAPTVSRVVKQFKGAVTKKIGCSIWQKSFYDRVIRNEREYLETWQYIGSNPRQRKFDMTNHEQ